MSFTIEVDLSFRPNFKELDRLDKINEEFLNTPKNILVVDYGMHILFK